MFQHSYPSALVIIKFIISFQIQRVCRQANRQHCENSNTPSRPLAVPVQSSVIVNSSKNNVNNVYSSLMNLEYHRHCTFHEKYKRNEEFRFSIPPFYFALSNSAWLSFRTRLFSRSAHQPPRYSSLGTISNYIFLEVSPSYCFRYSHQQHQQEAICLGALFRFK